MASRDWWTDPRERTRRDRVGAQRTVRRVTKVELRDFAERVLRGGTLAGKLAAAGSFTDRQPGAARAFERPARPPELAFVAGRIKDELPGRSALHRNEERGKLLHRFANHELLALEIMAATLLRFPDAPAAFRFGLAATMVEEQEHLGLYLHRMGQLGVVPGEIPVNDYFWRCLETVESPMDYVVRMALCFEQANLDFTLKYRDEFTAVGDAETAMIMQRVYDDEVGHVKMGLHFFRAWKPKEASDWDAFAGALAVPLSPARAKAEPFDRAGRERAGFDADFITRLALFSRSRGRPPVLYTFNPGCESEVATDKADDSKLTRELTQDLAPLMSLFAAGDDVVECPRLPSETWCRDWLAAGFALPERVEDIRELAGRKLGGWRPWGNSSAAIARVSGLGLGSASPAGVPGESVGAPAGGAVTHWHPDHARAYSKIESVAWRAKVIRALDAPWVVEDSVAVVRTESEALEALLRGWMLKAPFSTAGRGRLLPVRAGAEPSERERAWIAQQLAIHSALRAEPFQKRVLDLSFHFDITNTGVRPAGICAFRTLPGGQFVGTLPGRWRDGLSDPQLKRFVANENGRGALPSAVGALVDTLDTCIKPLGVRGPVGVDAMVVDTLGMYQLDPFVELNPRGTMGRLSLALDKRIHPAGRASWDFLPVQKLGMAAHDWYQRERAASPLVMERGLIRSGVLATNDPVSAIRVLTVLRVG